MSFLPPPSPYDPPDKYPTPETEKAPLIPLNGASYRDSDGFSTLRPLTRQGSDATLVKSDCYPEHGLKDLEKIEETSPFPHHYTPVAQHALHVSPPNASENRARHRMSDGIVIVAITIMISWPWAFFAIIYRSGGIQWPNFYALYFDDNPGKVTFLVTFFGTLVRLVSQVLFSFAIIRFGQEWIARSGSHVTVFDVSLLLAFRNQSWVWSVGEWRDLVKRSRVVLVVLVVAVIGGFTLVPSGTASLVAPKTFTRTAPLKGSELDLMPGNEECLTWLDLAITQNDCVWKQLGGVKYTTCLGNIHFVDNLESGRSNMRSLLSNSSAIFSATQLGADDGLQFLGPIHGVLPIGPGGVPALNNLEQRYNPFANNETFDGMVSYNYTLDQQGLDTTMTCKYDTSSPIEFYSAGVNETSVLKYSGPCDAELGFSPALGSGDWEYTAVNGDATLGFSACQTLSSSQGQPPMYYIYLRGRGGYESAIGNITCTTPLRPASFQTAFDSRRGYFTTTMDHQVESGGTSANDTHERLVESALLSLGDVVWVGQSWTSNLLAEAVYAFGYKTLGLKTYEKNEQYLRLYESMIQGILEYEAAYLRLIYSAFPDRPKSCNRDVNGTVTYAVTGWFVRKEQAWFLLPMTLVNLASFVLILAAVFIGKGEYHFDPTDSRPLLAAELKPSGRSTTVKWTDKVEYSQLRNVVRSN